MANSPLTMLKPRFCLFLSSFVLLLAIGIPARGLDDVIDAPMYKSPELPVLHVVTVFRDEKGLWLRAQERPEADLRCKAAEAIALAHRRGVKGLETTIAPLRVALDRPEQHPAVVLAVAQALIALDAREASVGLSRQAQAGDCQLRDLVEPALARWDYQPARAVWLARLREPATPSRSLMLAIRGLATVGEGHAADRLRELVLSERAPGMVRLEAARALGSLRGDRLEDDAERLAADTSTRGTVARLAAAALLRHHRGDKAVRLLQRLTRDPEPAVVAAALARLVEIGPQFVDAPEPLLASPDANVRSLAVDVLLRQPTDGNVRLLADRLDDVSPVVRVKARRSLQTLAARRELGNPLIAATTRALTAPSWRGQEQAAILLTQLEHQPAAARLLELLASERGEVAVTAAWGLRKLAVPETLPRVGRYVEAALARSDRAPAAPAEPARPSRRRGDPGASSGRPEDAPGGVPPWAIDHQLSQLNQFLGQQKYGPAEAMLRRFIPRRKDNSLPESRAAAIWALGLIDEGKPIPALVAALEERLNDHPAPPQLPEASQVQWMCAVTLGRLRAKAALASLRQYCVTQQASGDAFHDACGWAIERLTGEGLRPPQTIRRVQRDWFLTPNE
jgi:HEAT repeat protein